MGSVQENIWRPEQVLFYIQQLQLHVVCDDPTYSKEWTSMNRFLTGVEMDHLQEVEMLL